MAATTFQGVLELANRTDADLQPIGDVAFSASSQTSAVNFRSALIRGALSGTTANNRGSTLTFYTRADGGTNDIVERMHIDRSGNVGIGTILPQSSLHISNATPRINFFDTDAAISAVNPAWSVRGQNDGFFKIQTTADYATYTNRFLIDANGITTINSLAGTGSAMIQTDAAGVLSRSAGAPLIAGDMAHNFTPGTNNPNHISLVAMCVPSSGKVYVASNNYTTNVENLDITAGVGNEWNPDGSNNIVWVDFGDPNGAGTAYIVDIDVAVSGFENNDQTSAMLLIRMSNGDAYIRSTNSATVSGSSLDATANWGAWVLMPDPGE
jgi:hypothetical protein